MGIFLGSNEISNVYVGGNTANAVYLGSELVWPIDSGVWEYIYSYADDMSTGWSEAQEQAQTIAGNYGLDFMTVSDLPFGFDMTDSTTAAAMFFQWAGLKEVELRSTDSITSMYVMFGLCESLETVINLDTSNVANMNNMFFGCSSLVEVPLFDTSNVTNMSGMFVYCSTLVEVPLFDTSNVANMNNMFFGCSSLVEVPLFDTSNVTNMSQMFYECTLLESVPLFDTSNVTSMSSMFSGCSALVEVELTDCSKVTNAGSMFGTTSTNTQVRSLERLILPGMTRGFNLINTQMGATALNDLFHSLGTASGSQTINITGAPGAAACDKSIATAEGWRITG